MGVHIVKGGDWAGQSRGGAVLSAFGIALGAGREMEGSTRSERAPGPRGGGEIIPGRMI